MKPYFLFFIFLLISQVYCHDKQIQEQTTTDMVSETQDQINERNIKIQQKNFKLQINRPFKLLGQNDSMFFGVAVFDPSKRLSVNLYSPDLSFGFLYKVQTIKSILDPEINSKLQNMKSEILKEDFVIDKINKNKEYNHFVCLQPQDSVNQALKKSNGLKVILMMIYLPSSRFQLQVQFEKQSQFEVNLIASSDQIFISKDSLQKYFQFSLKKEEIYLVHLNLSELLEKNISTKSSLIQEQEQEMLIFHILHLVGDFQYNVSFKGSLQNSNLKQRISQIQTNHTESTFFMKSSFLEIINNQMKKQFALQVKQKNTFLYHNQIQFEIKCVSPKCLFTTEIQKNSNVRKVVPGMPYIYSIKKHQVFQISNPLDLQIVIDINKKNGFPQYQLCSTKSSNSSQNDCIRQLQIRSSIIHAFEVKQKDQKIHNLGRNNQIIINPDHDVYCFRCSYFISLYSDYDNILGMIIFKNTQSGMVVPQGNSITKVLKRNQTDQYIIYGLDSRILVQKFSGKYQAFIQQIYLQDYYGLNQIQQDNPWQIKINSHKKNSEQNYFSIDLKQCIESQRQKNGSSQHAKDKMIANSQNKLYKLLIKTLDNYPSAYYSLIMVNDESRKIVLKDGVPFYNKQKNKVSVFKYLTQNIQTSSFGTIIINSNQISEIQMEIYGQCLTLQQTESSLRKNNERKLKEDVQKNYFYKIKSLFEPQKQYQLQKISNKKINLMANRIDIIIQPQMCKSYLIKMINNATEQSKHSINYQILVSFIDSMILPLNHEVPGILQYPGKIIQIYEVFLPQKSNISIWINFCRSDTGRMQIFRNKEALFTQNSDYKNKFYSDSQLQETVYLAHPGIFYITIQFFGSSNILQYTILIKKHQVQEGFYYIDLSKQEKQISYSVVDGRFFSTVYKLYFSPIFLKHWSKQLQRDVESFQTEYFILQSNSYPLLKRASNCKGQFFSDIVNHHEHFKQVKLDKQKLKFHPVQKVSSDKEASLTKNYERGFYSYDYQTSNPLSFLIIVPVITQQRKGQNLDKQVTVLPYWKFDKKSRQPYQIIQLFNGKIYSIFEHWFISLLIWSEQIADFHLYQSLIAMIILMVGCMPATCIFFVCVYRTYVNIQRYCVRFYEYLQQKQKRQQQIQQQQADRPNLQQDSIALPSEEMQNFSQGDIQLDQNQTQINSPQLRPSNRIGERLPENQNQDNFQMKIIQNQEQNENTLDIQ